MPRISLIGPSYPAFSKAVSVQQSLNLYTETVEAPEGKAKQALRGRPGIDLFLDCTSINASANKTRGLWAGGGRLFVASNTKFFEIDINAALVGSAQTIATDNLPVDIISNRNQLFVVSGGTTYCDNGAGLVANTLAALAGTVNINSTKVVRWASGDTFDVGLVGQVVTINGNAYTVSSVTNPLLMILTANAATTSSGVAYSGTPVMTAKRGAFLDGYFVIPRPSSRQFNISALLDGGRWSQLDYEYKAGYPDDLTGIWTEPPLLYLLGTETLEIWRNVGSDLVNGVATFPLQRIDGGFSRVGLASRFSPVSIRGKLHMLAGGSLGQIQAVRMEGTMPVRISSHAMENALHSVAFDNPDNGVSFAYIEDGHLFWVIWIAGAAWVYDATEAEHRPPQECWHERNGWSGSAYIDYQPKFHVFIPEWNGGTHIVGDGASGKLYKMSSDLYDDDGDSIRYVRVLPYVFADGRRTFHKRLEVEIESGTSTPALTVQLDWSDDRGETFGTGAGVNTKMTLGPDVISAYKTRFIANALGSSRGRAYRLTITGKGRVAIVDIALDYDEGTS